MVNLTVEYLNVGVYGDELHVRLSTGKVGTSSIEFIHQIYNQNQVELARALTTSVFCDKESRASARIPEKMLNIFEGKTIV